MSIDCKWNWHNTGHQVWYDDQTFETLENTYPLQYYDDFLGVAGGQVFDGTYSWNVVRDVGINSTVAIDANSVNGVFLLTFTADAEVQDTVLFHDDNRSFDVTHGVIFEAGINIVELPTSTAQIVFGMCGLDALDKDAVVENAWFKLDGSGAVVVETDDGAGGTDNDDVATGVTAVIGTYNIYRIDFTTITDVKFFIDGVRVCASTTFDMSTLVGGTTARLQPYFSQDKDADAGKAITAIDYVKILSNRS